MSNSTENHFTDFPFPPEKETAAAFARLAHIIARLRAPEGCPWDREQTHFSLRKHLLEETYEVLETIENEDDAHLCEELGDLLMQPVMHAQLALEDEKFSIVDVLNGISDKLVRRHPHVFSDVDAADSEAVLRNWDAIKKQEKAAKPEYSENASVLDGVAKTLPSLSLAQEVSKIAAKQGFEWENARDVLDKLREEVDEFAAELGTLSTQGNIKKASPESRARAGEELADILFTTVNLARWCKLDAELLLRDGVQRFSERFRAMERAASTQNMNLKDLSPAQWDALWNAAKNETQNPS